MDLAMRNRVDGFEMAIGRHFSAPGFCKERNIVFLFDFNQRGRRRERDKSSPLFIRYRYIFARGPESRWQAGSFVNSRSAAKRYGVFVSSHLGPGVWLRPDERDFSRVDHWRSTSHAVDTTPERAEIESISEGTKNRVPRLEIKSSRTSHAVIYLLLGLTRLRRKYKYRVTILTNSFNVSSWKLIQIFLSNSFSLRERRRRRRSERKNRKKEKNWLLNFESYFDSLAEEEEDVKVPAIAAAHEFHMHELDPRIRALRIFRTFTPSVLPDCSYSFVLCGDSA